MTGGPFQAMPPLSADEYAALEASIAESGVQVPVILDEDGTVIDGHHRKQIAEALGIDYPTTIRAGLSDTEKRTIALTLNVARRHLNQEQRREVITASLIADPQLANREHARRAGCDHKTVGAVRFQMELSGEIPQTKTRVGGDGRERPAGRPKRAMTAEEWDANASTMEDRMTPEAAARIYALVAKNQELIDNFEAAWNGKADIALGYGSWREYIIGEFGDDPKRVHLLDASLGMHHYRQEHDTFGEFDAYLQVMGVPEPTAAGFRALAAIGEILERTRAA